MNPNDGVTPAQIRRQVTRVLDRLQVTDVVYHGLEHTAPLVEAILCRLVNRVPPPARLLLVGTNSLLAEALSAAGYELCLWRFGENLLTDDLEARIQGHVTPEMLAACDLPFGIERYDAIVLPFVLERVLASPQVVLAGLAPHVGRDGMVIVVTRNLAGLALRRRALFGQPHLPAWRQPGVLFSMNWPDLPEFRYYVREEIESSAREAGFVVTGAEHTLGERAYSNADFLSASAYLLRRAMHWVKRIAPPLRDYLMVTLEPATPTEWPGAAALASGVRPRAEPGPFVSVILPTHNRSGMLRDSLRGLTQQTYPFECFEVVLVNDGSTDDTAQVLDAIVPTLPFAVRRLETSGIGAPAARNLGMREARGEIVAHLDDDCRPCPEWLEEAIRGFGPGVAIVGGPVLPKPEQPQPPFSIAPQYPQERGVYPTANVFYRRSVALAAGGFDGSFGGNIAGRPAAGWDSDLAWRIRRQGYAARFQHGAIVYNEVFCLGPRAWLADALRAVNLPPSVRRVPELGRHMLYGGIFMDRGSMTYDLAAAGAALALVRRQPLLLVTTLPWLWWVGGALRHDLRSPRAAPGAVLRAAAIFAKQGLTLGVLLVGGLRARRLVL